MPIYDFKCSSCGHEKEVMRKVSAPATDICPACGKDTFSKQLSAPSFQLNGSGWYATDFKNSGGKPAPASEESSAKPAACGSGCACH